MYSIVKIIYGLPITEEVSRLIDYYEGPTDPPDPKGEEVNRWMDEEDGSPWGDGRLVGWGFKDLYHGGAPGHVGYCGVVLGEFDECQSHMHITPEWLAKLQPTEEQKKEAEAAIAQLHPHLREAAGPVGTYFVFHTS